MTSKADSSALVPFTTVKSFDAKLVTVVDDAKVAAMVTLMETVLADTDFKNKVVAIKTSVEFQGFDVRETLKALAYAMEESYKDKDATKNADLFLDDILFQIVFFIVRGVANQKVLNRTMEETAKRYIETATRLALVKSAAGLAPQVLTAPRLALSLPMVTTKVCMSLGGKNYEGPMKSKIFPAYIKNPAFPALIPNDNENIAQLLAWLYTMYSFDQSYTFSKVKPKQKEYKDIFEKQLTFTHMAINGSTIENSERISMLKALSVPDFMSTSSRYVQKTIDVFNLPPVTLLSNKELKDINADYATNITADVKDAFLELAGLSAKAQAKAGADEDDSI